MRTAHICRAAARFADVRKGLTMRALAALVECAPSDIYRMEKGHVLTPSADRLARLAQALGVTMDVLWLGDVDPSEENAALIAQLRGYAINAASSARRCCCTHRTSYRTETVKTSTHYWMHARDSTAICLRRCS